MRPVTRVTGLFFVLQTEKMRTARCNLRRARQSDNEEQAAG
jgi:hypothetical protein